MLARFTSAWRPEGVRAFFGSRRKCQSPRQVQRYLTPRSPLRVIAVWLLRAEHGWLVGLRVQNTGIKISGTAFATCQGRNEQ